MTRPQRRVGIGTAVALVAIMIVAVIFTGLGYFLFSSTSSAPTVTVTSTGTTTVSEISTVTTSTTDGTLTSTSAPRVALSGAGSTLVYPLMSAWAFAYGQTAPNVNVNYSAVGSGMGIIDITAKTVDFGGSDAPLTTAQYGAVSSNSTLLTIPISASGVVPAYNLPGISNGVKFTGSILARIFLGNITMWNDPALTAINPGISLPAHAIVVFHRSDSSGTMYAFTNYLSDSDIQWKSQVGTSVAVNWPTGTGCLHNEGVAGCISNTPYALGPLEIAYQIVNPGLISYGSVQNAAGTYVLANLTNIQSALAAGESNLPAGNAKWSTVSIIDNIYNNTSAATVYPITTFTYALVYQQQTDQTRGTALVNFLWWVVNDAQSAGLSLGYAPLPASVVALDDATIKSITFDGTTLYQ